MKYHIQIRMSSLVQVEIDDTLLQRKTTAELYQLAIQQARREYGAADDIEVEVENVEPAFLSWSEAEAHLQAVERAYASVKGMPRVNTAFAETFINDARRRFDGGERTQALHNAIMELE